MEKAFSTLTLSRFSFLNRFTLRLSLNLDDIGLVEVGNPDKLEGRPSGREGVIKAEEEIQRQVVAKGRA